MAISTTISTSPKMLSLIQIKVPPDEQSHGLGMQQDTSQNTKEIPTNLGYKARRNSGQGSSKNCYLYCSTSRKQVLREIPPRLAAREPHSCCSCCCYRFSSHYLKLNTEGYRTNAARRRLTASWCIRNPVSICSPQR